MKEIKHLDDSTDGKTYTFIHDHEKIIAIIAIVVAAMEVLARTPNNPTPLFSSPSHIFSLPLSSWLFAPNPPLIHATPGHFVAGSVRLPQGFHASKAAEDGRH